MGKFARAGKRPRDASAPRSQPRLSPSLPPSLPSVPALPPSCPTCPPTCPPTVPHPTDPPVPARSLAARLQPRPLAAPQPESARSAAAKSTLKSDSAPKSAPTPSASSQGALGDLKKAGNVAAWQAVCQHVRAQRGPLLLHGPVGCGKSHGLRRVVEYFALQHQVLDPSATHDEVRVALLSLAGSEARNHALVLEDVEGFPEALLAKFVAFADAHPKALLVAECKDPWALALRKLRPWPRVGLVAPDRQALYEVLSRRFPDLPVERRLDAAKGCAAVQRLDFRQALIACEHDFVPFRSAITEDDLFTRTRRFLKGADATDYAHHALDDGPSFQSHVGLLHHNMLGWEGAHLDRAARQLETLAIADAVKNEPTKLAAVLQFRGAAPNFRGPLPFPKAPPRARPAGWDAFRALQ